jgi:hypothetical protein
VRSPASQSADEWTNAIVDHGVKCPLKGEHFVWDDQVGSAFGVHWSDQSSRAQLLYNGLQTPNGREILLRTIAQRVDGAKRTRRKTAWDHVLEDD